MDKMCIRDSYKPALIKDKRNVLFYTSADNFVFLDYRSCRQPGSRQNKGTVAEAALGSNDTPRPDRYIHSGNCIFTDHRIIYTAAFPYFYTAV